MEARATSKFVRIGPRKVRRYLPLVRGKQVASAVAVLKGAGSPSTVALIKCIESAAANAENNHGMDADELWIKEAFVDMGFSMPRMRARARGRGDRYYRPTSHITVVVSDDYEDEDEE